MGVLFGEVDFRRASAVSSFLIWGEVELKNHDDLRCQFKQIQVVSDSELALAAYCKWGRECVEHLDGDFAFAVWDGPRQRAFLCRDHVGSRLLFYWREAARLIFAGDIEHLLSLSEIPRALNRRKLAGLAICGGHHYYEDETFHSGIFSLPAGCWMEVSGEDTRRERYWVPQASPKLAPKRAEDAFAEVRHLLFESLDFRLRNKKAPAVLLSGGLDSSAVAIAAATSKVNKNQTLTALAAVIPDASRGEFSDERSYIEEFRAWENISIKCVDGAGRGPFDDIEQPERFSAGFLRTSRNYLFDALGDAARAGGNDVVFSGAHGEIGITAYGRGYFTECLTQLRWGRLAGSLRENRSVNGTSGLRALGSEVYDLLSPTRFFSPLALLTLEFQAECEASVVTSATSPDHQVRQQEEIRLLLRKDAVRLQQTIGGAPVRFPLLDKDLIEFCLSAPGDLKVRDGYPRYLVRGALKDLLPSSILWRMDRPHFSPDYPLRYNSQLWKAQELVNAIGPRDPVRQIVDVDGLKRRLVPAPIARADFESLTLVPTTIQLICFLRQFSEFQA